MKNYKIGIILGIISIISSLLIVGVPIGDNVIAIGFLPGMIISINGLILTKKSSEQYKTRVSTIINVIGFIVSIMNLLFVIPNGGFIIK